MFSTFIVINERVLGPRDNVSDLASMVGERIMRHTKVQAIQCCKVAAEAAAGACGTPAVDSAEEVAALMYTRSWAVHRQGTRRCGDGGTVP